MKMKIPLFFTLNFWVFYLIEVVSKVHTLRLRNVKFYSSEKD